MAHGLPLWLLLRNFIFPPTCFACGTLTDSHRELLCPVCERSVRRVTFADPLLVLASGRLCGDGLCAGLLAHYHFVAGGPVQDLLHALKYGGLTGVGRVLGERVGMDALGQSWIGDVDMIVPMPLFRTRQRERGYNQSESIARGIAMVIRKPVRPHILRRARPTVSQTTLGYAARQLNVRDAFTVPPRKRSSLAGKRVLLVDDVVTTGATMRACAICLRQEGATAVYVAAAALAEQVP